MLTQEKNFYSNPELKRFAAMAVESPLDVDTWIGGLQNALLETADETIENSVNHLRERMMAGKAKRAAEGKMPSGYVTGYKNNEDGHFTIIKDQAEAVANIFDLYNKLENLGAVERELNRMGIKTRGGKNFTRQAILNLLRHPIFCGKGFRWKGKLMKGDIPPIVARKIWNKAQRILNSRSRSVQKKND